MSHEIFKLKAPVGRRRFLAGTAIAGASLAAPAILRKAWAADPLVYVAYGGTTQDAQERTVIKAFVEETGIPVVTASGPDVAKVKAQVQTGNIEWDVMSLGGSTAVAAERQGLLEAIDYEVVDGSDLIYPASDCLLPWFVYPAGIAYDPARFPEGKHPRNWAQMWDAEAFPGRRAFNADAEEVLEFALLADGVAPADLYPLDLDRAFASLDRVKPHVVKWFTETPQGISLILNQEADFTQTYSGRVEAAKNQGSSIEFVYEANLIIPAFVGVVKGTRQRENAMKLASYFMRADLQAAFNEIMRYTPTKRAGAGLLSAEAQKTLINANDPTSVKQDLNWWADNHEEANKRFQRWLLT